MSEYTARIHGLPRPIPYRLGESEICSYEGAGECVCMGDYVTVFGGYGPDGGELESTGELWGVAYGHDGFIEEVELLDEYGNGHRRTFPCEGVFYKAERPSGAIRFEAFDGKLEKATALMRDLWVTVNRLYVGDGEHLEGYAERLREFGIEARP